LRPVLSLGIISLVLVVVFVATHLTGNIAPLPLGTSALSASVPCTPKLRHPARLPSEWPQRPGSVAIGS